MAFIAFILGSLTALAGAVGLLTPGALAAMASALHGPFGLTLAAIIRLALGASLFLAAPTSRAPLVFRALGALVRGRPADAAHRSVARLRRDPRLVAWHSIGGDRLRTWSACAVAIGGARRLRHHSTRLAPSRLRAPRGCS
jgi:hypothetical protein